jgi:putative transposase
MVLSLSTSVYYYEAKRKPDDEQIHNELSALAELHRSWGFWMMFHHLRLNAYKWNHKRVIRQLEELIGWRGKPEQIRVDNGPEFLAQVLQEWCERHGITLIFIQKGKPTQNAYVERFNRTYRQEVLNAYAFESLTQARAITQAWMWIYNNERPHTALGNLPPVVFMHKRAASTDFPTLIKDPNLNLQSLITNVAS